MKKKEYQKPQIEVIIATNQLLAESSIQQSLPIDEETVVLEQW